ncbi:MULTISPECIES: hypothetical protein [Corallococcus]|uniref:aromatic-ring hydroxylase C-terminal domain-containing protein n=1 Tax=Corallococcus TaxID=83461 RepID=UPI0034CEDC90
MPVANRASAPRPGRHAAGKRNGASRARHRRSRTSPGHGVRNRLGLSAVLVRPDGFVAWASDTTPSPEELTRAAARWFTPREHRASLY